MRGGKWSQANDNLRISKFKRTFNFFSQTLSYSISAFVTELVIHVYDPSAVDFINTCNCEHVLWDDGTTVVVVVSGVGERVLISKRVKACDRIFFHYFWHQNSNRNHLNIQKKIHFSLTVSLFRSSLRTILLKKRSCR